MMANVWCKLDQNRFWGFDARLGHGHRNIQIFYIYFYGFKGLQNGKWTLTETQNRFEYKCDKVR